MVMLNWFRNFLISKAHWVMGHHRMLMLYSIVRCLAVDRFFYHSFEVMELGVDRLLQDLL